MVKELIEILNPRELAIDSNKIIAIEEHKQKINKYLDITIIESITLSDKSIIKLNDNYKGYTVNKIIDKLDHIRLIEEDHNAISAFIPPLLFSAKDWSSTPYYNCYIDDDNFVVRVKKEWVDIHFKTNICFINSIDSDRFTDYFFKIIPKYKNTWEYIKKSKFNLLSQEYYDHFRWYYNYSKDNEQYLKLIDSDIYRKKKSIELDLDLFHTDFKHIPLINKLKENEFYKRI